MKTTNKNWLVYAIVTTVFWGVWGAFTNLPASYGFPDTLIYCVWSITMIPPSLYVLKRIGWKLQTDKRSIVNGLIIGFLGAGGQMLLFYSVTIGPTYLIFPIISLSPLVTILLSFIILRERLGILGYIGVGLAILALPLFDYSEESETASGIGSIWFIFALIILLAWGVQAFFMKLANQYTNTESIFFYMMITGVLLAPIALWLTDFDQNINFGLHGPYLAASIQILNAIGCLFMVYAYRYGKALVVSPLINAGAPLMTSVISMALLSIVPGFYKILAILLAIAAAFLLALEPED